MDNLATGNINIRHTRHRTKTSKTNQQWNQYVSTVWDPSNQKKIKAIEQIQKRAARCVHNNYTDRTPWCVTNMVTSLKWENLEDRRKSAKLSMLFKIQHDLIDIDRQQYLTPNDSRTRGKNRFYGTKKDQTRIPTDNHSSLRPSEIEINFQLIQHRQTQSKDSELP
jgi:hypothetical protein